MSASANPNENNLQAMPAGGAPGGAGAIPDLMKIGSIPVNTVQEVETAILEPVVKSDTFCRFVFQNKGLLHSHSKVEIGLKNAPKDAFLPLGIGAYAFIKRVALKIGNQTICEVDDFNHYMSYRSMFVANENQKEREQMTTGRAISHQFAYADRTSTTGGGESLGLANGIVLDNGREADVRGTNAGGVGNFLDSTANYYPNTWQLLKVADDRDISTYQLALSELCPFLRQNQLPLYMLKEQVALELTFSGAGDANFASDRVSLKGGEATTSSYPIDTDSLRMISDHIFYPQELMLQYAQANQVLNFTYVDYRLSKQSVARDDAKSQMIRNIGGAGRIVSKVIAIMGDEDLIEDKLLNGYVSQACSKDYSAGAGNANSKNGICTINLKYNDTFEYPIDVKNPARHFHNVVQTEGMVPFITREEYSNEGESLSGRKYWDNVIKTNLQGKFFHLATKLTSQERINSRGIELYYKFEDLPANTKEYTHRVFLEVLRTATIQNGYTECYFA